MPMQLVDVALKLNLQPDGHTVGTLVSRLLIEGDAAGARDALSELQEWLPRDGAELVAIRAMLQRPQVDIARMRTMP